MAELVGTLPFPPIREGRIAVFCPALLVTGGAELLHQLVSSLVYAGRDAFVVYTRADWPVQAATPAEYERYRCPVARDVPDDGDTAVVVPEVSTGILRRYARARHVVWWLSVDNYRGALGTDAGWKLVLRRLVSSDLPSPRAATHLFQSAYARDFVQRRFGAVGAMLSDYLAEDFLSTPASAIRQPAVAYNPKKGYAFTCALIRACPGIEFVRLQGLSRAELCKTLDRCMVYIDFGLHPGKDRIPREAAIRGAVVIVGRQGSASFDEDMPLPAIYKFPAKHRAVPQVRKLILDSFAEYARHAVAQEPYREAIRGEPARFREELARVFALNGAMEPYV